jgi:site-specific DNA-cytosine methylase
MPTDWVVCGSTAKRDLQVGNSVPCGLIRDIFRRNA